MTETRTTRFNLPQWSEGTDSPSRTDFSNAFSEIEARAAYDDGASFATLPVSNVYPGRYALIEHSDGVALQRRRESGVWDWVGGTIATSPVRYRASADGDLPLIVDQGAASPKFAVNGAGNVSTVGAYSGAYALIAADGELPDAAVRGRLYVRTKADGERGLVLRPHGAGAGAMLAAMDSGGSVVTTLDSLGRLQQRSATALGGAALSTTQTAVVAPTNVDDGIGGMLAHGWADSATAAIADKAIFRVRGISTGQDLLSISRNLVALGRTGWTSGAVELRANAISLIGATGVTGALTATSIAAGALTSFGNVPIVVTSNLASITSPVADMLALLTTDLVWYRYTGSVWTAMYPARGGSSSSTRHDARYVQTSNQTIPSTAGAFTDIQFGTAVTESADVTAGGTNNSRFTLNRSGLWTIQASCSYNGNPGSGRRVMIISDDAPDATCLFYGGNSAWPDVNHAANLNAFVQRRFSAGQVVRVFTFQDSGNNISINSSREAGNVSFSWNGS